jgi:hypothetical protein
MVEGFDVLFSLEVLKMRKLSSKQHAENTRISAMQRKSAL